MSRVVRRLLRPRVLGVLGVAVVVAGGGWATYAATTAPGADYRTATAAVGDVDQTLALSGALARSGRMDLSFTASGTVGSVSVQVGDTVRAGQVLARLDRTSLRAAVTRAEAALAAARARLAQDEDAQASTVGTAASSGTPSASGSASASGTKHASAPSTSAAPTPAMPDPVPAEVSKALAELKVQQQAVTTAQSAATAAIADAKDRLAAQITACRDAYEPSPTATPTDGAGETDGAGATGGVDAGTSDPAPAGDADQACADALAAVQDAQASVATAQDALQQALATLAETLEGAVNKLQHANGSATGGPGGTATHAPSGHASGSPTGSATGGSVTQGSGSAGAQGSTATSGSVTQGTGTRGAGTGSTGTRGSSGSPASTGAQGASRTVTAATLAQDQADIDQANAELVGARHTLAGAVITAPRAGTVGAVDVTAGESATTGATAIVLLAPGTTTVQLGVPSSQLADLKVGQVAQVTPAGAGKPLAGTLTRIGQLPDTSGGSTTYPVLVTLDDADLALPSGGTAAVDVVVGTARDVVTVPTSAVTGGSVLVLSGGAVERVRVGTGVVGRVLTEITSGLRSGQRVVLADLGAALPTGNATTRRFGGGVGGLGGLGRTGGFPAGAARSFRG